MITEGVLTIVCLQWMNCMCLNVKWIKQRRHWPQSWAVILLMECEVRIDHWLDRELMSRLALVLSLGGGSKVVEDGPDDGGVDSKLAVILLALIEVDADESAEVEYEDMEVFATLDVAVAVAVAAVAATLRASWILFCLL